MMDMESNQNSILIIRNMGMNMKSSQINFYLSKEDIAELESFILSSGLQIIQDNPEKKDLIKIDSLTSETSSKKFIVRSEDVDKIQFIKTKNSGLFIIDQNNSPVIEFWNPTNWQNSKVMPRGRVYYIKDYYNTEGILTEKPHDFILTAETLFKWIKKQFKNVKIPGFEMFLVSPRTYQWMQEQNGQLMDMVTAENLKEKKFVA